MDGLVFLVVIVVFSLLEGVLRKQKAAQQARLSGQAPDDGQYEPAQDGQLEDGRYGLVQDEQFEATYDGEPAYDDDRPSYNEADDIQEYSSQYTETPPSKPAPSETLIPKDVWEELAALVAGAQPQASDLEQPAPPAPRAETTAVARTETTAVTQRATRGLTTSQEHIVHGAHVGYGTDPSQRAPSEQDGLDPLAEHLGVDAGAVRQLFASRDSHALRQAIILQEVLGLPSAFRGDPYDP
jgi:hypothetical protein